ncbi:class I SAM-dependent methyltransferase [Dethiobacter alkaliphilus]|uniref:Methyltransferase type 11 n=1 Tax=Dethiobacter alkaliphilus AHT 1 TaxID=555088 RepID=C0GKT3_DETAL|nr:class I SAM-dependent methyltransferase [Dethiobacter alkaliphilus]EEG76052.1 Methyltransferase type 11 [Dethiobacter alkaliphilus AHT 1]
MRHFTQCDTEKNGAQYLEDLATGYWYSEALFAAVEMDIFSLLEEKGMSIDELSRRLQLDTGGLARFLQALSVLGLVTENGHEYCNTPISATYLVADKEHYQGDSILWRKALAVGWQGLQDCLKAGGRIDYPTDDAVEEQVVKRIGRYIKAMDCVAKTKVLEILPIFADTHFSGQILDVGTGSGAVAAGFLRQFPDIKATLLDISWVLDYALEMLRKAGLANRINCVNANILEPWPVDEKFKLVILSNVIHVYAEKEVSAILAEAVRCLDHDGFVLIHDFFLQHSPSKAALFDLNMFIHTYNGKVFDSRWVREELKALKLSTTPLIPLATDTGIIVAAKSEEYLHKLNY